MSTLGGGGGGGAKEFGDLTLDTFCRMYFTFNSCFYKIVRIEFIKIFYL